MSFLEKMSPKGRSGPGAHPEERWKECERGEPSSGDGQASARRALKEQSSWVSGDWASRREAQSSSGCLERRDWWVTMQGE